MKLETDYYTRKLVEDLESYQIENQDGQNALIIKRGNQKKKKKFCVLVKVKNNKLNLRGFRRESLLSGRILSMNLPMPRSFLGIGPGQVSSYNFTH